MTPEDADQSGLETVEASNHPESIPFPADDDEDEDEDSDPDADSLLEIEIEGPEDPSITRQAIIDEAQMFDAAHRADSERRRANAELLGALGSLLRGNPSEIGFSTEGTLTRNASNRLDAAIIAVLAEVESDALRSAEENAGEESYGEGDDA